jgi:hypothetical protein
MEDGVDRALALLNDALRRDPDAMTDLVNLRVRCNDALAAHPTITVGVYDGVQRVGILGLLNGILGDSPSGVIGAKGRRRASGGDFAQVHRFVDMRREKTDVLT